VVDAYRAGALTLKASSQFPAVSSQRTSANRPFVTSDIWQLITPC